MARDSVCGMEVSETQAAAKAEHQGRSYDFCSADCRQQFQGNPGRYGRQTA